MFWEERTKHSEVRERETGVDILERVSWGKPTSPDPNEVEQ